VRGVGQVDEVLAGQLGPQRLEDAQAADAAVENADGNCGGQANDATQAAVTAMFLNSPVAIFLLHSAGPVVCTLVPPASTATVTGMSTTSNS
jgi:hypothetical protein